MKYRAYGIVTGAKYLGVVEADSEEQAKHKALELDNCFVSLCHQCDEEIEDPIIDRVIIQADGWRLINGE